MRISIFRPTPAPPEDQPKNNFLISTSVILSAAKDLV